MNFRKELRAFIKESILVERRRIKYRMVRKPDFLYKERSVQIDSEKHISLLKNTIEHLEALRSSYSSGSAMRHVISQASSRLKRLLKKLETV